MSEEEVLEDEGGESEGVAIEYEEVLVFIEDLGDVFHEVIDHIIEFPFLSFGAMAVCGGIHDDGVIFSASFGFAFDEFESVF